MPQHIVIVGDKDERTVLTAQALRDNGYGVTTLRSHNNKDLHEKICRLQPDFLLIGDDVVIDLKSEYGKHVLYEIALADYN